MEISGISGTAEFRPTRQHGTFTVVPNTFHFDGHEFAGGVWGNMPTSLVSIFDLAYRARRGDEAALAVIEACGLHLTDIDGNVYISRNWRR